MTPEHVGLGSTPWSVQKIVVFKVAHRFCRMIEPPTPTVTNKKKSLLKKIIHNNYLSLSHCVGVCVCGTQAKMLQEMDEEFGVGDLVSEVMTEEKSKV